MSFAYGALSPCHGAIRCWLLAAISAVITSHLCLIVGHHLHLNIWVANMEVHCRRRCCPGNKPNALQKRLESCKLRLLRPNSSQVSSIESAYEWQGQDEFSSLQDRMDSPPLPLPSIRSRKRIVLVRHGQSTWNAEGRIQGSSNFSCLTPKGMAQAETTRDMVSISCSGQ